MDISSRNEDKEELIPKFYSKDKLHLVYLIIFCTGIGTLIPWNYFITARQYFIFKVEPNNTTSPYGQLFENYLSIFSMIPIAITNMLNLVLRRYITPMSRFNFGVSVMFIVFLFTLVLTKVTIDSVIFFWLTMISAAVLNVCSGLIQGSAMGIVSMMPSRYIKSLMEGQALSGILASVSNIISIALVSRPDQSAFIYFFIALIILMFSGIGFCALSRINFSKEFVIKSRTLDSHFEVRISDDDPIDSIESITLSRISFTQKYVPLLGRIRWFALSAAMSFLVTLSVFPSFTSAIQSYSLNTEWKTHYFSPVTSFLFFNVGDYLGRFLCGFVNLPSKNYPKTLFLLTMLRWILVPLFFLCNIADKINFPSYLANDVYPIILTWILGITNGYLITLSLVYAPGCVQENEKEAVGTLMSLFMCIGLASGVAVSFLYRLFI